jgi:DNA modification methylase
VPDSIIITGDCLEILPTLPAASVNLVFTSPPYPGQKGNSQTVEGWLEWLAAAMRSLVPLLAPAAVIGLNVTLKRTPAGWFDSRLWTGVPAAIEAAGLNCLDTYIWNKTNAPQNGPRNYADAPGYEVVYVYTNAGRPADVAFTPHRRPYAPKSISKAGEARIGYGRTRQPNGHGARQTNVISLPTVASDGKRPRARGISFPLELPMRFIGQYRRRDEPGYTVLDFCAGVGTTCRAAQLFGLNTVGIELDPDEAERARAWLAEPLQDALLPIPTEVSTP